MINTLGELITVVLALAAIIIVPYKIVRAWWPEITRLIMSITGRTPTPPIRSAHQSVDQSAPTSLEVQTSVQPQGGLPDMDAAEWATPPASSYLSDEEFIVFLAMQKLRDGKFRLSANTIVKTVGGDRTQVLAIVRQVREGPAVYPNLTPDKQRA